ncbi:MAG: multifunctional oxoglutarate decarboxylase/oxoglutarate dehydrogenase thiamine pyrophosphate-binding subunit/dihydrolipoyllysine-residue succinyltransferase subunit [Planctomycetota bacterium]|nr:MAG: multifunctional oxoglutarate decarboxylase/oxoglutarate dehydrogenase thiamine pyrophosphate-binding subunit/dihydrolipoyllysine-residue succinyltransferase subunit [Planctomycetota bacterium]
MAIDFEREFGVNAAYVQTLFEQWRHAPEQVQPEWRSWFEQLDGGTASGNGDAVVAATAESEEVAIEPLRGVGARIAENMIASLEVPTATSVRTLPVKVLEENRRVINAHMAVRVLGKASYTHLIAYALVQALREQPSLQSYYEERDGRPYKATPRHVNLGLAIDMETPKGRALVVPNIKKAETLDFKAFHAAYEEVVARARTGKLEAADFRGTTASLSNPGGFGTHMSVPRLVQGQGLIVATGTIAVPPAVGGMAASNLAAFAIGPVMTMTSTYDHRVIQGAESGLLLKRVEDLLQGADEFYERVFGTLRVPWRPFHPAPDAGRPVTGREEGEKQAKAWELINAYRVRGLLQADLDPLEYRPEYHPSLDPASYGFTIWDLDREFLASGMCGKPVMTLREILEVLRESYCRRWTVEYMHIADRDRKWWVRDRIEPRRNEEVFDHDHRVRILERLIRAENFEQFLHMRFVGNKRFSLEGAESLIPALAEIIERAAGYGVEKVVIGMAHRGRLNVLANILSKSYEQIFQEFEGTVLPRSSEGSGDVKYHLGQRGVFTTASGQEVEVVLSANPSHLEAVDPVVCGMVRGFQDEIGDTDRCKVLAILIHGDAAFAGQGVVAETLQMSNLPAYRNGGTLHLVVNNQIGFTTSPRDARSTAYCTDIAKMIQAPILHANGDYPEAVLRAGHVAVDYWNEFHMDAVIDMVCYRRRGHNEGDDPAYTQPLLYRKIEDHASVRVTYTELLLRRKALTPAECEETGRRIDDELHQALEASRAAQMPEVPIEELVDLGDDDPSDYADAPSPETGVPQEQLVAIVDRLNRMPEGFVVHPNLLRQLRRRERMVRGEQELDWGCAEALAFGALLQDAVNVRLCGQDSGRGTFSQRHAIIRDQVTEADYVPLADLASEQAGFEVRDSLLSEEAALAFEYGYAVARPAAMVLWEAQFGDFANGAQVPIDQFLASGAAKWRQIGGVTLLLPHGYDGQGPEHSSARIERFLQLCSEGNMTAANCSTSGQYFHLLRRQGRSDPKRPLIIFTPKSLLRDKRAASPVSDLAAGRFLEVVPDAVAPSAARRVVLCSGKVYHDLADFREKNGHGDVALVRVEQLYPFPRASVRAELGRYPGAEVVWCQEEPMNMGAWSYMLPRFLDVGVAVAYAGRAASASPATGSYKRHQAEQEYLIRRAFGASA